MPLLVSVPHGGLEVPPELKPFCRLDLPEILRDGDTWSDRLYGFPERVLAHHRFPVARAVLDVNRAEDDRPPANPDGVVKTVTVEGRPVWLNPRGLTKVQVESLLEAHYRPYHRLLEGASLKKGVRLALDCHTMLDKAPAAASHPGEQRPYICLGNRGDARGEVLDGPVTAPPVLVRVLARTLEAVLRNTPGLSLDPSVPLVAINQPFRGGWTIREHGTGRLPWIQLEVNRALYLAGDPRTAEPDREAALRIQKLQEILLQAFVEILSNDL
nr:N-formylglutamate amidohydrolase [Anaerotalea alkaliphila]